MYLFLFVEEPSIERLLNLLLPKIIEESIEYQFIIFRGKNDLLRKLETRLRVYRDYDINEFRFVVLIDRDNDDCKDLKMSLESIASKVGFSTKSNPTNGCFQLLNRIVIEELEAWYFGDFAALHSAYPRISSKSYQSPLFRNPDNIRNGTWETLERLLQRHGYYLSGLSKIQLASEVGPFMNPLSNRSHSFQVFLDGLQSLLRE